MAGRIEDLDLSDVKVAARLILDHVAQRVESGDVVGLMVILETDEGGFACKMSAGWNVATRLGVLDILKDEILRDAEERA